MLKHSVEQVDQHLGNILLAYLPLGYESISWQKVRVVLNEKRRLNQLNVILDEISVVASEASPAHSC